MTGNSLTILFLIKKNINDPRAPAREPQIARRVNVSKCRRVRHFVPASICRASSCRGSACARRAHPPPPTAHAPRRSADRFADLRRSAPRLALRQAKLNADASRCVAPLHSIASLRIPSAGPRGPKPFWNLKYSRPPTPPFRGLLGQMYVYCLF